MFKFISTFAILFVGLNSFAQTEGLTATEIEDAESSVILSFAAVVNDREDTRGNNLNYGGGVLIEANFNDQFGVETGLLFVKRQYVYNVVGVRAVQEVNRAHVPATARFWLNDFLSVGIGPFLAFKVGAVNTSFQAGEFEIGSISTSASEDIEWGLDTALTVNMAVNDKTGLFVEGRYSAVLNEAKNEDSSQLSALAGLKVDI